MRNLSPERLALMQQPSLPSLDFLFGCSDTTLADLEMAFLNRGARSLKIAKAEWESAVHSFANADVARYFREHREEILEHARKTVHGQSLLEFPARRSA